jgi:hypothetical protein
MIVIEKTSRGCIILVILVSHVVTPQEQVLFLKMIEAFRQEHWGKSEGMLGRTENATIWL